MAGVAKRTTPLNKIKILENPDAAKLRGFGIDLQRLAFGC
jgi:hypothetical protein